MRVARRIALSTAVAAVAGCAAFRTDNSDAAAGDATVSEASASDVSAGDTSDGDGRDDSGGPQADDGGADGRDADAVTGCNGAAACVRHVFMTSTTYSPNQIANPPVAYGLCSDLVNGGSGPLKGRHFEAWLSGAAGNDAARRLVHGTKQYVSTDGSETIAANWTALTSGTLETGITRDENGALLPPGSVAWTRTAYDGTAAPTNCSAWASNDPNGGGAEGVARGVDFTWTNTGVAPCNVPSHLLCVEQ